MFLNLKKLTRNCKIKITRLKFKTDFKLGNFYPKNTEKYAILNYTIYLINFHVYIPFPDNNNIR